MKANAEAASAADPGQPEPVDLDLTSNQIADHTAVVDPSLPHPLAHEPKVVLLDPACIRVSAMPNRSPEAYVDEAFDELCLSITMAGGNVEPICVRPMAASSTQVTGKDLYELVWGERRLRACAASGLLVRAIVAQESFSRSYLIDALLENISREDLAPYEFGRQVQHIIANSEGMSLGRLATIVGRDKSQLSRALDLAQLPQEVVGAFGSPRDLRYADAKPLSDALSAAREAVLERAKSIHEDTAKLKAAEVVKLLTEASRSNGGSEGGTGAEGVAPCNTPATTLLTCEDKSVGAISLDRKGQVQISLSVALSDGQQAALARHIETFVRRRVLRLPAASPAGKAAKAEAKDGVAAATSASQGNPSVNESAAA